MKKIYFFLLTITLFFNAIGQQTDFTAAKTLVKKNAIALGISPKNIDSYEVSSTYIDAGTQYIYLTQTFKGITVRNQMKVLAFKGENLVNNAGAFLENTEQLTGNKSKTATVKPIDAVRAAFAEEKLFQTPTNATLRFTKQDETEFDFGKTPNVIENIKGKLTWLPVFDAKGTIKNIELVWEVTVAPTGTDDMWQIFVNAKTGIVIGKENATVYENHADEKPIKVNAIPTLLKRHELVKEVAPLNAQLLASPTAVSSANYLVIPYPVEAPSFGAAAVRSNPWEVAGAASPLGWHSDGTNDYTITRGNNVWATEEAASVTGQNTGFAAASTTTTSPLNFNFPPDFSLIDPRVRSFQQFATTNLFYWNNIVHDITYLYGFNEVTGNFQTNNQGRGGAGNDNVIALAQSAAGGAIGGNANFSTPVDGARPRMRMYIFENPATTKIRANSPSSVAGDYQGLQSLFSINNNLLGNLTGQAVYFDDVAGTHLACDGAPTTALAGKIAIIDRGTCSFVIKVKAAQNAGAIAAIVVNNVPGAFSMGPSAAGGQAGADNTITIPAFSISQQDGNLLAAQIANNLNVTLMGGGIDGDLDNGVIAHEFGHGVSNRLTGGPANSSCLSNAEQGGEGWSDYLGLLTTTDWANTPLTDGPRPRGIGTYASGQPTTGAGIRPAQYSTSLATNNLSYANMGTNPYNNGVAGTSPHAIGTIWCTALWDMTWGIIQQEGSINPNLYNFSPTTTGGNSIALKLVLEGMKLQPCSPGFIDARNAILAADRNLYCGKHACTIWTAFAKRGMGFGATQGSSGSTSDQIASSALPPAPSITTQPLDQTANEGTSATFTASAGNDVNLIYQWQVSTDNGQTYTNINCEIRSTLTITNVTAAMNGYKYRSVVSYACETTTTNAGTLIIAGLLGITAQPTNTSTCIGATATFTAAATGSNVSLVWEVSTNGGGLFTPVVPAATTATLTLNNVSAAMNNNQYRLRATNTTGTVLSNAAVLTVSAPITPSISTQPVNTAVCSGSNASFTVASPTAGVTYSWQVSTNGGTGFAAITPAVTTATLTLTGVTAAMNNNQYRVVVTGGCPATNTITSNAVILTVNASASFVTQPVAANVCQGSTATFSTTTAGANVTYQWFVKTSVGNSFVSIAGATLANFTTPSLVATDNGNQYQVEIKNTCTTSLLSNIATLNVQSSPTIITQPSSVTLCSPARAIFTVFATGTNLTYQWQSASSCAGTFTNISGATDSTYIIPTTTTAMNGMAFRVIITGTCVPTITSNCVTLTVNSGVAITNQPSSSTTCAGSNVTFTAATIGDNPSYQWQVKTTGASSFTNITGATAASLTLNAVTATMSGNQYHLVVTNNCPSTATTIDVTLTVQSPAAITTQPLSLVTCTGAAATFTTVATGTNITYQWQTSATGCAGLFTDIVGATNASYSIANTTLALNGSAYKVVVNGVCVPASVTSNCVTLTVNPSTTITQQPASDTKCVGTAVTFTTAAIGGTVSYQWQVSTDGGTVYSNINGETNASYTIAATTIVQNGNKYKAIINSACANNVSSNVATLTVNAGPVITSQPLDITSCTTTATFTVIATGTALQYQWQVSTDGTNYSNINGANAASLTLTGLTAAQANNKYKVIVSTTSCGTVTSNPVSARVGILPTVVLTASPSNGFNPSTNGSIIVGATPANNAYVYQWKRNDVILPNVIGTTITKANGLLDDFGTYIVTVTDPATNCFTTSSAITVTDVIGQRDKLFVSPNPATGPVTISYYSASTTAQNRIINVFDEKGYRIYSKQFSTTGRYGNMVVDLTKYRPGTYIIALMDKDGNRLSTEKLVKY